MENFVFCAVIIVILPTDPPEVILLTASTTKNQVAYVLIRHLQFCGNLRGTLLTRAIEKFLLVDYLVNISMTRNWFLQVQHSSISQ